LKSQRLVALIAVLAVAALCIALGPFLLANTSLNTALSRWGIDINDLRPKLGLDIEGGARVVLQADLSKLPKDKVWDQDTRNAVYRIISQRVNANGVSEAVITPKGTDQFVVELPAVHNTQQILDELQNTARLELRYSPDWRSKRSPLGRYNIEEEDPDSPNNDPAQPFVIHDPTFVMHDLTTGKWFRDRFHIDHALADTLSAASLSPGAGLTADTLPDNLAGLAGAQGHTAYYVTPDQKKQIDALADELTQFDSFLSQSQLILDGSDLLPNARGSISQANPSVSEVDIEFNTDGKQKFGDFTRDHTDERLMIYLDGRILMVPGVDEPILEGRAQISPFRSIVEAKELADYLNGGALPVPMTIIDQKTEAPTIGADAVHRGLIAGLIGLALVVVFMLWVYLLPGAVACGALLLYALFAYAAFIVFDVTFTLPGIAGFILSVGMAVDANILIFERTKEELRDGRPMRSAIEAGFQRAFSAILDSNVCTAVTSLCLFQFGTGEVKGFALTLLIGVALSMFTAITVSRTFLLLLVQTGAGTNRAAWGVDRSWQPRLDVVRVRKYFYGLSLAVIVPGLIFAAMGGFKLGIDFTGGTEIQLQFAASQTVTRSAVESAVRAQGYDDPSAQIAGDNTVYLKLPRQHGQEVKEPQTHDLVGKLQSTFPGVTEQAYDSTGPSISAELTWNALLAIAFSSTFIVIYLAFRFAIGGFVTGLKFGVAAIIAMLHDVCVLVGVFSILGYFLNWKIDSLFVTGALTVVGFSVHDTIVIFDRIRENLRGRGVRASFGELVSRSINETFTRSINTSFTVILTLLALLVFGGPVIRPLNAALLIGIISGTYSSIFNAAPLVVDWERLFGRGSGATTGGGSSAGGGTIRPLVESGRPAAAPGRSVSTPRPVPVAPRSTTNGDGGRSAENRSGSSGDGYAGGDASSRPPLPPGPKPRKRRM
jgi:SecD/SecF fusion protein